MNPTYIHIHTYTGQDEYEGMEAFGGKQGRSTGPANSPAFPAFNKQEEVWHIHMFTYTYVCLAPHIHV